MLNIYEVEFNKLSDRWFTEGPWPEAERIASMVENGGTGEGERENGGKGRGGESGREGGRGRGGGVRAREMRREMRRREG